MSSRRSSRSRQSGSSRNNDNISDEQIADLVSKLQQLLPEIRHRRSDNKVYFINNINANNMDIVLLSIILCSARQKSFAVISTLQTYSYMFVFPFVWSLLCWPYKKVDKSHSPHRHHSQLALLSCIHLFHLQPQLAGVVCCGSPIFPQLDLMRIEFGKNLYMHTNDYSYECIVWLIFAQLVVLICQYITNCIQITGILYVGVSIQGPAGDLQLHQKLTQRGRRPK